MPAVGGVARRATTINQEKKKNPYTLVLDAGDSLVGDQDPALKTQGKSSVEAMNRLGYDAMALGPGDLALGLATLRARMAEAKFPMLSANAVVTGTADLVAKPYAVREFAGHRVAVVGLSGGNGTTEIGVRDPLAAAQKIVPEARKEADIVILLSHAGQMIDQQIADQVPGIAAIVSGGEGAAADGLGERRDRRAGLPRRPGDGRARRPDARRRQAELRRRRKAQVAEVAAVPLEPRHRRRSDDGRVGATEQIKP